MASSRNSAQITWSSADSISLSNSSRQDSDAFAFNVEDWEAELVLSADNSTTPASGDYVDVYIKYTVGDVLGDSSDDFPTNEHAEFLCRLDTWDTNIPGEDPARKAIPIRTGAHGFKLSVVAPNGGTHAITFRARIETHRGQ